MILNDVAHLTLMLLNAVTSIINLLLHGTSSLLLANGNRNLLLDIDSSKVNLDNNKDRGLLTLLGSATKLLPLLKVTRTSLIRSIRRRINISSLRLDILTREQLNFLSRPFRLVSRTSSPVTEGVLTQRPISFREWRVVILICRVPPNGGGHRRGQYLDTSAALSKAGISASLPDRTV